MKKESESKYPTRPIFSLDQRVARQYVRQWSEELDEFLSRSIEERNNFIIKKMLDENIPGFFLTLFNMK